MTTGDDGHMEEDVNLEDRILTLLSMDSRISNDRIAESVGATGDLVHGRVKKIVERLGIRFVPEINLVKIEKYECLGLGWGRSKRELLNLLTNRDVINLGFEEYIAFLDFKNKEPGNAEVIKAIGDSYLPQYIARIDGQRLFMYAVARNSLDMYDFMYDFTNSLNKFDLIGHVQFVYRNFGYFPLNDKLITEMQINAKYKKMLLELNKNAKAEFSSLRKEFGGVTGASIGQLYSKLRETDMMVRSTLFITKPEEPIIKAFMISIVDRQKFTKNKHDWFLSMVKDNFKHYIFMGSIANPTGLFILARFSTPLEVERFKSAFERSDMGIELSESTLLEKLYGNLGIRNFAPEETIQYKELEAKNLVHRAKSRPVRKAPDTSIDLSDLPR